MSFGILNSFASEPITPLIKPADLNKEKFALGELLFHDTRLSKDKVTSCHSCHNLTSGGDDGLIKPAKLGVNTPTVFNASKNYYIGWRGNFNNLKAHLEFILANPNVMGTHWNNTINAFNADTDYQKRFNQIYKAPISKDTIIDAILYYEENLILPSDFDQYLLGDREAISPAAQIGYDAFKDYGCISCHQGVNIGGNLFQELGVFLPYKGVNGDYKTQKLRVPSLRNVAQTAPYLNDGSIASLNDTIHIMAEFQLGLTLTNIEVSQIIAFLESLNSNREPK